MKELVIIGGGITGLSAAWFAKSLSTPPEVTVVEAQARLGGQIRTVVRDGFRLEEGSDCFTDPDGVATKLCEQLGIAERLRPELPRTNHLFVRHNGSLFPIPDWILDGLSPAYLQELAASSLLSESARRRLNMEAQIPPVYGQSDESIAHFVARRLGPEVERLVIEPLINTLYAGDPARLSADAVLPHLKDFEYRFGSLMRGVQSNPAPRASAGRLTFPGGLTEIIDRLESKLAQVRFLKNLRAVSIRRETGRYRVSFHDRSALSADAIICALPAYETASLIEGIDAASAALLRAIPYASPTVMHLGYRRKEIAGSLDGYGYVVPGCDDEELVSCTWQTCRWDDRAPENYVLLRFYTGAHSESSSTRSDEELFGTITTEARSVLTAEGAPTLKHVVRWRNATPLYNIGHNQLVNQVEERLARHHGVFLAGSAYHGIGIAAAVASAANAVRLAAFALR